MKRVDLIMYLTAQGLPVDDAISMSRNFPFALKVFNQIRAFNKKYLYTKPRHMGKTELKRQLYLYD